MRLYAPRAWNAIYHAPSNCPFNLDRDQASGERIANGLK